MHKPGDNIRTDLLVFFIVLTLLTGFLLYRKDIKENNHYTFWKNRIREDYQAALSGRQSALRMMFEACIHASRTPSEPERLPESVALPAGICDTLVLFNFSATTVSTQDGTRLLECDDSPDTLAGNIPYRFTATPENSPKLAVEAGISFQSIRTILKTAYYPAEYFFVRKKDILESRGFPAALLLTYQGIDQTMVSELNRNAGAQVTRAAGREESFARNITVQEKDRMLTCIPVDKALDGDVLYLVSVAPDDRLAFFRRDFITVWAGGSFLLLFLMGVHLWFGHKLRSAGRELEAANAELLQEVDEKRETEARLREQEKKLTAISEASLDALIMGDSGGKIVFWNRSAERLFGYSASEIMGKSIHRYLAPESLRENAEAALKEFARTGRSHHAEKPMHLNALRKDGSEFPVEIILTPVQMQDEWCSVAAVRDITHQHCLENRIQELSTSDPLTRLLNHDYFMELSTREFSRARRYNHPLSILLADVDGLKNINDENGYEAGDHVLKVLAAIIQSNLRNTDIIARICGGKLGALLPDTGIEMACIVADRLRHVAENTLIPPPNNAISRKPVRFTVSMGIAQLSEEILDIQSLLRKAETALAEAKQAGRNRIKCDIFQEIPNIIKTDTGIDQ